ncbi:MAG: DUF4177 domain-containing protein [Rhodanobacter sp.]
MNPTWEYKTITVKNERGMLRLTEKPSDEESTSALNREGALGWELVNAVCLVGVAGGVTFYFKRPR